MLAPRIKAKKCKLRICRIEYLPVRKFQKGCCIDHEVMLGLEAVEKEKRLEEKRERQDIRRRKTALKTYSEYRSEAQDVFNRYVRIRDYGKPCASCGSMPVQKYGGTMDCSHYRSVGAAPHLRFNLHNVAAACVKCNQYLGGNAVELRRGLVARIGLLKIEAVEANNETRKFTVEYFQRIKRIFAKKTRRRLSRIEMQN